MERAQRAHTEEFYEIAEFSLEVAPLNQELQAWERTYNTIRPHQALGYLTPQQYITQWLLLRKQALCHSSPDGYSALTRAVVIGTILPPSTIKRR